jgi:hypothetical protein
MAGFDAMAYVRADPVERAVMREIQRVVERRMTPDTGD